MIYSSSPMRVPTLDEMVDKVSSTLSIDRQTVQKAFKSGNTKEYREMIAAYSSAKGRKPPAFLEQT